MRRYVHLKRFGILKIQVYNKAKGRKLNNGPKVVQSEVQSHVDLRYR